MPTIKKMSDENEKKQIFFECHKNLEFIFKKVKKFIQVAFLRLGKQARLI